MTKIEFQGNLAYYVAQINEARVSLAANNAAHEAKALTRLDQLTADLNALIAEVRNNGFSEGV